MTMERVVSGMPLQRSQINISSDYVYNLGCFFENITKLHLNHTALIDRDGLKITYEELNSLSNKIALLLLDRGIKKSDVVAIFNQKDIYCFACMIACLKIGAIYVNLDFTNPPDRISKMLDVASPKLLWTDIELLSALKDVLEERKILVENYKDTNFTKTLSLYGNKTLSLNSNVDGNSAAYIMFTSGSTGFPKGAVISHSSLINFVLWAKSNFSIDNKDRISNLNPMHFDNSVFDFYSSIFTGAAMIALDEPTVKNPRSLIEKLNYFDCTIWFSVPSLLGYILTMRAFKKSDLRNLRMFIFGGEAFPKKSLRDLADLFFDRVQFYNVYGPTECTCICSCYQVTKKDLKDDQILPLGQIAVNFDFIILNESKEVVKNLDIGELYLTGPNVGLGYYEDEKRTNVSFLQLPLNKSFYRLFYKTGDLVRFDPSLNFLFFCGRVDNQIKKMGYRIELEEIEIAIGSLDYINEVAVIFNKDEGEAGKIIAYIKAEKKDELDLISDLRKKIPSYMIPDKIFFLDSLQKNKNGKIDKILLKSEWGGA